ncbi:hypothetical protein BDN72DRAFT_904878 [Pluteus cervinus]|uniref:Uncharacterized protein n=1 Tax=Pluteus cervinus TaxID=181527 RepID=A0ACD3A540_9AGAR|nr:hypothetical protein BDN72DRAFT_904878 [Pluteus cervinus]
MSPPPLERLRRCEDGIRKILLNQQTGRINWLRNGFLDVLRELEDIKDSIALLDQSLDGVHQQLDSIHRHDPRICGRCLHNWHQSLQLPGSGGLTIPYPLSDTTSSNTLSSDTGTTSSITSEPSDTSSSETDTMSSSEANTTSDTDTTL